MARMGDTSVEALDDDWWMKADEDDKSKVNGSSDEETRNDSKSTGKQSIKRKIQEAVIQEESQKKKRKKKKFSEIVEERKDDPLTPDDLITHMNTYFSGRLSAIEQDEILLDVERHFMPCNVTPSSATPSAYLTEAVPRWSKLIKKTKMNKGSPLMLVISSSGQRAADVCRQIEEFKTDKCRVAKLFAKHLKLKEQTSFLASKVVHIGVGTPNRITALTENGALKLTDTHFVVLDWSWRDVKLRRLVDVPEVKKDLYVLFQKLIIPHVKSSKCLLGLM